MDQIRKWGCHFEGKDPVTFLERVEELQAGYGYSGAQMLLGLPELLRGEPLLWYRNRHRAWSSWEDFCAKFKAHYLPRRYQARLRKEANTLCQQSGEPFAKYATSLLTLTRRAEGYTEHEQLELLIENMDPECRMFIRPSDVTDVQELADRAAEYEELNHLRKKTRTRKNDSPPASLTAVALIEPNVAGDASNAGILTVNDRRGNSAHSAERMIHILAIVIRFRETRTGLTEKRPSTSQHRYNLPAVTAS
jgi:hypothetical protein